MIPVLPSSLVPQVAAYSGRGAGGVSRIETGGGAARYRVEWARGRESFDISMNLSEGAFQAWNAFYHHMIRKGALPFTMRLDSGLGTMPHTVYLVPGSYQTSSVSGLWSVGFTVECDNPVYALSQAQVDAYGLSEDAIPSGFVPTLASYSFGGPGGVMRDEVDGGLAGYGSEWERGPQKFSCTLILTQAEYARWIVWFHRKINKGAQSFTMRLNSGNGTEPHQATIIPGSYSTTRSGGTATVVSFGLEAESSAYQMTAEEAESLVNMYEVFGDTGIASLLARISQFANVDTIGL